MKAKDTLFLSALDLADTINKLNEVHNAICKYELAENNSEEEVYANELVKAVVSIPEIMKSAIKDYCCNLKEDFNACCESLGKL